MGAGQISSLPADQLETLKELISSMHKVNKLHQERFRVNFHKTEIIWFLMLGVLLAGQLVGIRYFNACQ